jgi:hypothetical protein
MGRELVASMHLERKRGEGREKHRNRALDFFGFATGTFRRATYLTYTTTQDGPSLPQGRSARAQSPSGAWVVSSPHPCRHRSRRPESAVRRGKPDASSYCSRSRPKATMYRCPPPRECQHRMMTTSSRSRGWFASSPTSAHSSSSLGVKSSSPSTARAASELSKKATRSHFESRIGTRSSKGLSPKPARASTARLSVSRLQ